MLLLSHSELHIWLPYVYIPIDRHGLYPAFEKAGISPEFVLNDFGVKLVNGAMEVAASKDDFPLRKHNLIQAMLAINDLFYLASPMVSSLFLEDVVAWLDENEIRYTPSVKFTGKSGYDHLFDFVIPKSKKRPERILQAINRPSRDEAGATAFARDRYQRSAGL